MQTRWWLELICVAGCDAGTEVIPHHPVEGVEEISESLSDLTAQCTFTAAAHRLQLTLNAGDIAVIARTTGGGLTINDLACGGATATTVYRIDVTEGTSGDQTLILDYGGGLFATGVSGAAGVDVNLGGHTTGDALKLVGTSGADSIVLGAAGIAVNADGFVDVTAANIEELVISLDGGDDSLSGAGNPATGTAFVPAIAVYGGNGNDSLRGGAGDDTLTGGNGNDTFTTGASPDGNDTLHGGAGIDTVDYAMRTAALTVTIDGAADDGGPGEADNVGTDIEVLKGGLGDDHLTGSASADTISGGPGNDTIDGGDGNDVLNGDAGDDSFEETTSGNGGDVLNGGAGIDTASYAGRGNSVIVILDALANDGEVNEGDKVMLDVERVVGGSGNDSLTGSAIDNLLTGGAGNDTLSGGAGNDTLRGGADNDTLRGDAGDDVFDEGSSGNGADSMFGGPGIDRVDYTARTGDLVVTMDGVTGSGEAGEADLITSDVENLIGGDGADSLTGNALDNQIEGGPGPAIDTLDGGAGDDVLDGNGGADIINGNTGDADINLDTTTGSVTGCEV